MAEKIDRVEITTGMWNRAVRACTRKNLIRNNVFDGVLDPDCGRWTSCRYYLGCYRRDVFVFKKARVVDDGPSSGLWRSITVVLMIPKGVRVHRAVPKTPDSPFSGKCRAAEAVVVGYIRPYGRILYPSNPYPETIVRSIWSIMMSSYLEYEPAGRVVRPHRGFLDKYAQCGSGIHYYETLAGARQH